MARHLLNIATKQSALKSYQKKRAAAQKGLATKRLKKERKALASQAAKQAATIKVVLAAARATLTAAQAVITSLAASAGTGSRK